jgi:hypothetical protein
VSVFKTKKKIGGVEFFKKWDEWTEGDTLYVKFRELKQNKFKKDVFICEIVNVDNMSDPTFTAPKNGEPKDMEVGDKIALTANGNLGYLLHKGIEEEGKEAIFAVAVSGTTELPDSHEYAGTEVFEFDVQVVEYDGAEEEDDNDDL